MSYKEWYKKYVGTGLGANDNFNKIPPHDPPILLEKVDMKKTNIDKLLNKYEKMIKDDKIENAIVIRPNGEVYRCFGVEDRNFVDSDLKDKLYNSYVTHNHPKDYTNYSFSSDDRALFSSYNLKKLRGIDNKYTYELNRTGKCEYKIPTFLDYEQNQDKLYHYDSITYAKIHKLGYKRWKNDK